MSGFRRLLGAVGLALAAAAAGALLVPARAQILDNPTWDKARIQMERRDGELERSRVEIERGRLEADRLRDQPRPIGVLAPPPRATQELVDRAEAANSRGALLRQSERLREQQERAQIQADKPR